MKSKQDEQAIGPESLIAECKRGCIASEKLSNHICSKDTLRVWWWNVCFLNGQFRNFDLRDQMLVAVSPTMSWMQHACIANKALSSASTTWPGRWNKETPKEKQTGQKKSSTGCIPQQQPRNSSCKIWWANKISMITQLPTSISQTAPVESRICDLRSWGRKLPEWEAWGNGGHIGSICRNVKVGKHEIYINLYSSQGGVWSLLKRS